MLRVELVCVHFDVEDINRLLEYCAEETSLLLELFETELLVDEGLSTDIEDVTEMLCDDAEEALELSKDELDATGAIWYIFRRARPPQYSLVLAVHKMLQPFTLGIELVWLTLPALITLPQ